MKNPPVAGGMRSGSKLLPVAPARLLGDEVGNDPTSGVVEVGSSRLAGLGVLGDCGGWLVALAGVCRIDTEQLVLHGPSSGEGRRELRNVQTAPSNNLSYG